MVVDAMMKIMLHVLAMINHFKQKLLSKQHEYNSTRLQYNLN